jgi:hypothetical protein
MTDMTKTVTLTLEQAETALRCVEYDIEMSKHGEMPDYDDIEALTFYLRRAELAQRLNTAIANALKEI